MGTLPLVGWLLVGGVIAIAAWVILHVVAVMLRDHARILAHAAQVKLLRDMYTQRLKELEENATMELDDDGNPVEGDFDLVETAKAA